MFKPLFRFLRERVKTYSFGDEILAAQVLSLWEKIIEKELGTKFVSQTKAVYFRDSTLQVLVFNSSLLQELKLKEPEIKNSINYFLKRSFVSPQELKRINYKIRKL